MDCAVELAEHFRPLLSHRLDVDTAIARLMHRPPNARNTDDVWECLRMIGELRTLVFQRGGGRAGCCGSAHFPPPRPARTVRAKSRRCDGRSEPHSSGGTRGGGVTNSGIGSQFRSAPTGSHRCDDRSEPHSSGGARGRDRANSGIGGQFRSIPTGSPRRDGGARGRDRANSGIGGQFRSTPTGSPRCDGGARGRDRANSGIGGQFRSTPTGSPRCDGGARGRDRANYGAGALHCRASRYQITSALRSYAARPEKDCRPIMPPHAGSSLV
jgi:hypothetical protein